VADGNGNLVDGGAKSDLASAEQGELADTAVQPGDAEALPTDGTVGQILVRDPDAAAGRKWSSVAAGVGDMLSTAYDPAGKGEQVLTVTDAPSDPDLSTDTDKLALRGDVKAYADQFGNYSPTFNLTRVRSVQERLSDGIFLDDFTGATDTDKLLDFAGSGEGHLALPTRSRARMSAQKFGEQASMARSCNGWEIPAQMPSCI
jgi:hypothetical protein